MLNFQVSPGGSLSGSIRVPGDKSMSHRSIILGSLAVGDTEISGFLEGEDSLCTLAAFRAMGVDIEHESGGHVLIRGQGLQSLKPPKDALYLGNSGTAMRLMAGVLAGQVFPSQLTGDASLSGRPMGRVINPLAQMGAVIDSAAEQRPPLNIQGRAAHKSLKAITYTPPVVSAQIKSCLLLAGLYADGETTIIETGVSRDHTERMLKGFGYEVKKDGLTTTLAGGGTLTGTRIDVPADVSSTAFFMVGALIAPGSDITLTHVGINPTRAGIIDILTMMGGDITLSNERVVGGEPVADIRVRASELHGIDVPTHLVPVAIDEFPAIFVAAAVATGRTTVSDAAELRVKESDRIQVMVDALTAVGVSVEGRPDGAIIDGGPVRGGQVNSHGDHRPAMAMAMLALCAETPIVVTDCDNVSTSFPGFAELAANAGLGIAVVNGEAN